ncbi:MAG: hypothetical protein ACREMK_12045 [Gemmatimonadota bacterium]
MTTERSLGTVLFTDIVGSTVRAAELGDREWRELLDRPTPWYGAGSSAMPAARSRRPVAGLSPLRRE